MAFLSTIITGGRIWRAHRHAVTGLRSASNDGAFTLISNINTSRPYSQANLKAGILLRLSGRYCDPDTALLALALVDAARTAGGC